jgi:hypothetical protein
MYEGNEAEMLSARIEESCLGLQSPIMAIFRFQQKILRAEYISRRFCPENSYLIGRLAEKITGAAFS